MYRLRAELPEQQLDSLAPQRSVQQATELSNARFRVCAATVILLATFAAFFNLGGSRTLTDHEALVGTGAREMLQTGDWIIPRLAGNANLVWAPLIYWLVATLGLFRNIDEFGVRLPAALSAVLTVALVMVWARKWYGDRAAIAAGLVQATSVYVIMQGRLGEADMMVCLLVALGMALLAHMVEADKQSSISWQFAAVGFHAVIVLAWLAKFTLGPILILTPCLVYLGIQAKFQAARKLAHPVGLLLYAVPLAWHYAASIRAPEAWSVWKIQLIDRAFAPWHRETIWTYPLAILWLTLPWTPWIIAGAPQSWIRAWREKDSRERFLWVWFLAQLFVLSVVASKHKHYILPALPPLSLVAGAYLGKKAAAWERRQTRAFHAAVPALLFLFIVTHIIFAGWLLPRRDPRRATAEFSETVNRYVPDGRAVYVLGDTQASLIFYLNRNRVLSAGIDSLKEQLRRSRETFVIAPVNSLLHLRELGDLHKLNEMTREIKYRSKTWPCLALVKITSPFRDSEHLVFSMRPSIQAPQKPSPVGAPGGNHP